MSGTSDIGSYNYNGRDLFHSGMADKVFESWGQTRNFLYYAGALIPYCLLSVLDGIGRLFAANDYNLAERYIILAHRVRQIQKAETFSIDDFDILKIAKTTGEFTLRKMQAIVDKIHDKKTSADEAVCEIRSSPSYQKYSQAQRETAVHEAGHAHIITSKYRVNLKRVAISPALSAEEKQDAGGITETERRFAISLRYKEDYLLEIEKARGGEAAEVVILKDGKDRSYGLKTDREIAKKWAEDWEKAPYNQPRVQVVPEAPSRKKGKVKKQSPAPVVAPAPAIDPYKVGLDKAINAIQDNFARVETIATYLQEYEVLNSNDFMQLDSQTYWSTDPNALNSKDIALIRLFNRHLEQLTDAQGKTKAE